MKPFQDGPIHEIEFRSLNYYRDSRGWLVELYREDEVELQFQPVMSYFSQTQPGVARGPHVHVEQADHFVFMGPGDFEIYLWDARRDSPTFGNRLKRTVGASNPSAVIVPPGVVHAYKNVGDRPGWVVNLPNRLYAGRGKREPVDEIRHEDVVDSPYRFW